MKIGLRSRSPLFAYLVQIFRLTIVILDSEKIRKVLQKKKILSIPAKVC